MDIRTLYHKTAVLKGSISLPASKSESNRALVIHALAGLQHKIPPPNIFIDNLSEANDTAILLRLLTEVGLPEWNVGDAGTVCRFMTAFAAVSGRDTVINGSERMKERPLYPLIDALRTIGVEILYLEKEGYPPVKVSGKNFIQTANHIEIRADISSQFISALLMIAPLLPMGLEIHFSKGEIISLPYITMTLAMMKYFHVEHKVMADGYKIFPQQYRIRHFEVEADWSAASYLYSFAALSEKADIFLPKLRATSLQGDSRIAEIMQYWGVESYFSQNGVRITKKQTLIPENITINFTDCPDLAQTVIVVAAATGVKALCITGLQSLKIKETDRITALQKELAKFGILLDEVAPGVFRSTGDFCPTEVPIFTYKDHRMAMAFAPLIMKQAVLRIADPEVVRKSFPTFWEAIGGFTREE